VLIAGGYGYGNIGDEAQLAANIQHWKKAAPHARITVLTPDVPYTQRTHPQVSAELAPRTAFFGWKDKSYFGNEKLFKKLFFPAAVLLLFNARLMRAGLPVFGITARQARLLDELWNADVLFLSGGGYLTGMTLSRLWDHMLLLRLADLLGVPSILSGQTIGVFKDRTSKSLSRWGLKKARRIYLRDPEDSAAALQQIGVPPAKVKSTFDDALYYKVSSKVIPRVVSKNDCFSFTKPYIAVNVHYWGQSPASSRDIMRHIAGSLDSIITAHDLQVAFIPMSRSDEAAIHEVAQLMQKPSAIIDHGYDIDAAIDTIRSAAFCLTMKHHPIIFAMGGGVPTIAMAFDDYYFHKNRGALKIFALENCLIYCAPEQLGAEIIEKMRYLFDNQQEIRKKITETYSALEPRAGEVIYAWLQENNL
jgi:polysaccharide pyruvyl transferase WcaK-like protein